VFELSRRVRPAKCRSAEALYRSTVNAALGFAFALLAAAPSAWSLDKTKLATGADHLAAHETATGKDVKVGVIEIGGGTAATRGIDTTKFHFAGRLVKDLDFVGSVPPLAADPGAATGNDDHATLVADVIASNNATFKGVAPEARIYHGAIGTVTDAFKAAVDRFQRGDAAHIFNHSWQNGAAQETLFIDFMTVARDTLHVVAAGNSSGVLNDPALIHNGLTVGALGNPDGAGTQRRAGYSDYQAGGRAKPDLVAPGGEVAPGDGVDNDADASAKHIDQAGTSFAAPHVTGVVALLAEEGLTMGTGTDENRLAQRAIIMNSARKRHINTPDATESDVRDNAATGNEAADDDYLTAAGTIRQKVGVIPKTDQWTPSAWDSPDGKKLTVTDPLDDELGTGALDARRALIQHAGGEQKEKHFSLAGIDPIGWNRTFLNPDFGNDIYEFNFGVKAGTFVTATLVWDRPVLETDGGTTLCDPTAGPLPAGCGVVNPADTYAYGPLPDFDLFIYKNGTLWAESKQAGVNTVEHLHFALPENGNPFEYSIQVDLKGTGTTNIDYALAWWTHPVSEPATMLMFASGVITVAATRRRRSGGRADTASPSAGSPYPEAA